MRFLLLLPQVAFSWTSDACDCKRVQCSVEHHVALRIFIREITPHSLLQCSEALDDGGFNIRIARYSKTNVVLRNFCIGA